jgi:hypothetical protein
MPPPQDPEAEPPTGLGLLELLARRADVLGRVEVELAKGRRAEPPRLDPVAPAPAPPSVEAAGLAEWLRPMAEVLAKLSAEVRRLRAALEDRAHRGPEPLGYRKVRAAQMVGVSTRLWERLVSSGKAPRPDARAGKCPLWTRATLARWLAEGGSR